MYDLAQNRYVELKVIDLLGRQIRILVAQARDAGHHQVTWNGLDDRGQPVASGVYLYTLKAEGYTETRKLLLIR
jgi:flagellar hook assembly protein FlgD